MHAKRPPEAVTLSLLLLGLSACGAAQDPATPGTECTARDECAAGEVCGAAGRCVPASDPDTCDAPIAVPWLGEGNFWQVAWSEIDYQIGLFDAGGDYAVGSYSMTLGAPEELQGVQLFPLKLNGDTQKHTPRWTHIGTDGCGNIFASAGGDAVRIFSLTSDAWTGRGFWTDFAGVSDVRVDRNATVIPSKYSERIDAFKPPVTSVGHATSQSGIGAGTGCEYFEGYGTICGSDDPGASTQQFTFEYWASEAGPIAYAQGHDYDSGGSLSTERHGEERVDVWFFGNVEENNFRFEQEPDSCQAPTPLRLPGAERVFTMYGEINKYDAPAGAIPGVCGALSDEVFAQVRSWYPFDQQEGQRIAAQVQDWYSFEIVDPSQRVELYLVWNEPDVELDLYWFAAPDDPTYGFLYFGEDYLDVGSALPEFKHRKGIPNPTTAGKYLLGVRRATPSDLSTPYGIMVLK